MGKFKYLMLVEGGVIDPKTGNERNNNKYFKMTENGDGTFSTEWGRVGCKEPQREPSLPMSQWDKKYKSKTNPNKPGGPYTDITDKVSQKDKLLSNKQIIHKLPEIVALITFLQEAANIAVSESYLVKSESVTQMQVDEAQASINNLSNSFKRYFGTSKWNIEMFNAELKKLFTIIPRKMGKVGENLITANSSRKEVTDKIENEQSFLDSMAGQVVTNAAVADAPGNNKTLLETMGLGMDLVTGDEFEKIKRMLGGNGHRLNKVFKVVNNETQKKYDEAMKKAANKKTELLFHGSRSSNWYYILSQGLKIRPSGAIHTGSLLGDGIYFANDADKSLGYTDNGRWVNGRASNSVYLGIYEVRVGNKYEMRTKTKAIYDAKRELFDRGYCSVHAYKGCATDWGTLRKDEITIYDPNQSTIKYLLDLKP